MIDPDTPLNQIKFVFFDLETTGLSPRYGDEICEFGAVKTVGSEIVAAFDTLINPGRPISPEASFINGITDGMVKNKPEFDEVYPAITNFFGEAVLVAHHAMFDVKFLAAAFKKYGFQPLDNLILDSVRLSRKLFPDISSYRLSNLKRELGIHTEHAHRALDDSKALAQVFSHCLSTMRQRKLLTLKNLLELHGKPLKFSYQGRKLIG